ncbi:MAG: hypothetical protein HY520_02730 [Candidatus Aenigmarchaeota archaeon]|nr:hypothetical protein [Candidatus Aenigmarchaeota archaeon]
MKMKALYAAVVLATLTIAAAASASVLISSQHVNANSCFDTDGGDNVLVAGSINATLKDFSLGGTDHCIDQYTVGEYACSNDVPGTPQNYAAFGSTDCRTVLTNGICQAGRCVGGLADLTVTSFRATSANGSNSSNVSVTFEVTVKNIGINSAPQTYTSVNVIGGGFASIATPGLAPNALTTVTTGMNLVRGRTYNATATADWTNLVSESNENNNARTITFTA